MAECSELSSKIFEQSGSREWEDLESMRITRGLSVGVCGWKEDSLSSPKSLWREVSSPAIFFGDILSLRSSQGIKLAYRCGLESGARVAVIFYPFLFNRAVAFILFYKDITSKFCWIVLCEQFLRSWDNWFKKHWFSQYLQSHPFHFKMYEVRVSAIQGSVIPRFEH